jgi:hypothetical protein
MRTVSEAVDGLRWSQPSCLRAEYLLTSAGALVASLTMRGWFGTLATAESGDGSWTFERLGFWQKRATIRAAGSETSIAGFRNTTWPAGGILEFQDGSRFRAAVNFWHTRLEFRTEAGELLLRYRYGGILRRSAEVEIPPEARRMPQLPVVVLFGWYLVIMLDRDAGAVAVTG